MPGSPVSFRECLWIYGDSGVAVGNTDVGLVEVGSTGGEIEVGTEPEPPHYGHNGCG